MLADPEVASPPYEHLVPTAKVSILAARRRPSTVFHPTLEQIPRGCDLAHSTPKHPTATPPLNASVADDASLVDQTEPRIFPSKFRVNTQLTATNTTPQVPTNAHSHNIGPPARMASPAATSSTGVPIPSLATSCANDAALMCGRHRSMSCCSGTGDTAPSSSSS